MPVPGDEQHHAEKVRKAPCSKGLTAHRRRASGAFSAGANANDFCARWTTFARSKPRSGRNSPASAILAARPCPEKTSQCLTNGHPPLHKMRRTRPANHYGLPRSLEGKALQIFRLGDGRDDGMIGRLPVGRHAPQDTARVVGGGQNHLLKQHRVHMMRAAERGQRAALAQ